MLTKISLQTLDHNPPTLEPQPLKLQRMLGELQTEILVRQIIIVGTKSHISSQMAYMIYTSIVR